MVMQTIGNSFIIRPSFHTHRRYTEENTLRRYCKDRILSP
jgi:hypothetical protein